MYMIHSRNIPKEYLDELSGALPPHKPIPLEPSPDVYESISAHPDIFFFLLNDKTLIHSPSVSNETLEKIRPSGLRLIPAAKSPSMFYPHTSMLSAVRVGKRVIHNARFTDTSIVDNLEDAGSTLCHVNQGYTRCSIVPAGSSSFITSDDGIYDQASKAGFDILRIVPGNILLPKEEYGFIGGTAGVLPDGGVVFLGDIEAHPDGSKIAEFLNRNKTAYISLKGLPLFEAGSLLFIREFYTRVSE